MTEQNRIHTSYEVKVIFYHIDTDAFNFVTPFLLKAFPISHFFLGLLLSGLTLAFLIRIILSWYPQVNSKKGFWLLISYPTEPILQFTRRFISPIGGVDVTPVIWVGLVSLTRELLVGQQGILSQILMKYLRSNIS